MHELTVLVIEDEDDVRDALLRDLEPFADAIRIEAAASVADADDVDYGRIYRGGGI